MHPTGNKHWKRQFQTVNTVCLEAYEMAVAGGMCPEQARFMLPQGTEVSWYWTGSIAAFARFVKQRLDPHAQVEIQNLAKQVSTIIKPMFPVSWEALAGENND
jgi:thymidylate synthase (FAD)